MSVNVYLKGEKVKDLEGFEVVEWRSKEGEKGERYRLPGRIDLSYSNGRWSIYLSELEDKIPSIIADIVEEISFQDWLSESQAVRESGFYRHKSAEAELIIRQSKMRVHIRGKQKKDLLELLRKIKAGSIRPYESHEGKQDGLSHKELEEKIISLEEEKKQMLKIIEDSKKAIEIAEEIVARIKEESKRFRRIRVLTSALLKRLRHPFGR